jgi:transposase-like protein
MDTELSSPPDEHTDGQVVAKKSRRVFTAEERANMVQEFRSSDQTQRAFCRQHRIHPTTLGNWLRRSREQKPTFAEVSVAVQAPAPIEVDLPNGIQIRVRTTGDVGKTADLIRRVALPQGQGSEPC